LFGTYRWFQETFPSQLSEEGISVVLSWAIGQLDGGRSSDLLSTNDDLQESADELPFERPVGKLDPELLDGIVERALTREGALNRVRDVARLIRSRLIRFDEPPLPGPIDIEDEDGREPPNVGDMRRAFARSLVELFVTDGTFNRGDVWTICDGWDRGRIRLRETESYATDGLRRANRGRLLTTADFTWAYEAASEASTAGDNEVADALAQIAGYLFDFATFGDLVYVNRDHLIWPHVKWWFEPTALDSEDARLMREAYGHRRSGEEQTPWAESEQFVAKLNHLLDDAAGGDPEAFWLLAWNLQAEPATGRLQHRLDDDILDFPGIAVLGPNHVESLLTAATRFVSNAHDHADEWLGSSRYDKRGWAGYLGLALLERRQRLSDVPETAWPSWLGALVWFHSVPGSTGDRGIKTKLLFRAAQHAASQLADAAATYIRGELTGGQPAWEVELIDPAWHVDLANTWIALLAELSDAISRSPEPHSTMSDMRHAEELAEPDDDGRDALSLSTDESRAYALHVWEIILSALLTANDGRAADVAYQAFRLGATDERYRPVAVRAAKVLLSVRAADHLSEVITITSAVPALGQEIAIACATGHRERNILADLDEEQLADLYRWLSGLFPPETDVYVQGTHFISPEEESRDWRDQVLKQLSELGTQQAVRALAKLRDGYPDRLVLTSHLLRARTNLATSGWFPPSPEQLAALFKDARRRLVRSENELADLLIEVLNAIGEDVPAHGELLWDRLPRRVLKDTSQKEAWLPKMEPALSAYVCHELTNRLKGRGLAVNREVLVRPTDASGAGDRTDIQVEATTRHDAESGPVPDRIAVVIEIKGPWNEELMTAQRDQLAKRYLPETGTDTGIYLVGWYPLDQWTDEGDYRRARARNLRKDQLVRELRDQAGEILTELSRSIEVLLLDIPRPHRVAVTKDPASTPGLAS
jgi:hypothetical protein